MKTKIVSMLSVCLLGLAVCVAYGQGKGAIGLGMNAGAQRIYGDRAVENWGMGTEGVLTYRVLPFADVALAVGYNQLKYKFTPVAGNKGTTSDLFNFDLKSNVDIINSGIFRPYVTLGTGLVTSTIRNSGFGSNWAAAFLGGGGFKFQVSPKFDIYLGADYRFTTTDRFDRNVDEGKAKDGYFNARAGITYRVKNPDSGMPQVIADRVPTYQLDGGYDVAAKQGSSPYSGAGGTQDMEQYVRLKSRVDQLTQDINAQEEQIVEMQTGLSQRKKMMAAMETQAAAAPKKNIVNSTSMSGFSEIYQEALTNYYNKSYAESVSLFRLLLQQYPNHNLAGSCQFWLAQNLYDMQQYRESIDALYQVLTYEKSLKKDDALLLMGKAYLKVNMGDQARETFNRLVMEYPASEFVGEAQNYLSKL
jgi:TolA-binding protein